MRKPWEFLRNLFSRRTRTTKEKEMSIVEMSTMPPVVLPKKSSKVQVLNPVQRQHQKDALTAIRTVVYKGTGKGKVILPTGTGKTRIEAEAVCYNVKRNTKKEQYPGVYVVLSPRILLSYQQLKDFITIISNNGIECQYKSVHSGGIDSSLYEKQLLASGIEHPEEIESTTTISEIASWILIARQKNMPLVLFSTYHSADRVAAAIIKAESVVEMYIYDEAQYCVSKGDFQNVPLFASKFKFFFTATEKTTDAECGLGMNNEDKFGKVIFTEKPKTMIERGEMASIAIHLVGTRGASEMQYNDYESMARVVIEAFDKHREVVKSYASAPDLIGPKMVVICDSQDSLKGIMRSKALRAYKSFHHAINLCALSSDYGIEINGKHSPRVRNKDKEYLILTMRKWKAEDEAIVLHVDMISEGIDVPGITGIMPFRNLGKIKFLQNLGRGTRLVDSDRSRLYDGTITPKDWPKYVKPYCWLILPVVSSTYYDMKRRYEDIVKELRSEYGFSSSEMVVIDNIKGISEEDAVKDMVGSKEKKFFLGKGMISEIVHSIEDGEAMTNFIEQVFTFNVLSAEEQVEILKRIYNGA